MNVGNYKGNPNIKENFPADIPPEQNCSFWLSGLPGNTDYKSLLAALRGTGSVYQCHLTPPQEGRHLTSAAKVIFFDLAVAQHFWARFGLYSPTRRPLVIGGNIIKVERNRTAVEEPRRKWPLGQEYSRVLRVTSRAVRGTVNAEEILKKVKEKSGNTLYFELEGYYPVINGAMDILFSSFRAQAHTAWVILKRHQTEMGIFVKFARDPCTPLDLSTWIDKVEVPVGKGSPHC
ncbi:hypothetical protein QBC35DRAFT_395354 [Podospora australis]|uniref:RRM domain-containing protein n=1 Tax=Podospora australis TaxID=1536484 RepID=A0AAN6WII6_9PEZI|nr:hypothetical protein QBC35DRAFT_395354 [Podospora australis]